MPAALVLLSGGLDSTVCMAVARRDGAGRLLAVSFDYGQRHRIELDRAAAIAREYGAEHLVVAIDMRGWGGSALTDWSIEVPGAGGGPGGGGAIPVTYVPARNLVFLSLAAGIAEARGAGAVYLGVNALDYSGYPDCRPEFVEAFRATAALALKRGVEGEPLDIRTPLAAATKADIVRLGRQLEAPLHLTWSCYRGGPRPCGDCDSCALRAKGFAEAGVADPKSGPSRWRADREGLTGVDGGPLPGAREGAAGGAGTLVVSEVFGPTLQGEGPSAGRAAGFVRLGRCNLACHWCDTPYTWDWERHDPARELTTMAVADILALVDAMDVGLLVVSGGEPLLQQRHLPPLLEGAKARGWTVEIETAGTIAPTLPGALVDRFNVSPKLANSGMTPERRYRPDVLRAFQTGGRAVFKFVVADPADLAEVDAMVAECGLGPVWVMPEGTDAATVLARMQELAPHVLARRWNLTPRLHVLLWGDRRGT